MIRTKGKAPRRIAVLQKGLEKDGNYRNSNTHSAFCNTPPGKILVASDDGDKTIGLIKNGVFIKSNWHSGRHLCFKHNAIGVDKEAFENYVLPYAQQIECHDRDKDITYTVSVKDFEAHCIEDNLGWGIQLFCPLKFWQVTNNGHHQLSLWGGDGNA